MMMTFAAKSFVFTLPLLAVLLTSTVKAAGTDAPKPFVPPMDDEINTNICSDADVYYCAPAKVTGKPCVVDRECLTELCQGNVCVSNPQNGGLGAGSKCAYDDDCAPGLACEDTYCE